MAIDTPARIAIVGAGPIGLEAALYAKFLGYEVDLFEAASPGEHIRRWCHVRMTSPFGMNRSPLAVAALEAQGHSDLPPDEALLTGDEYLERFLLPLAESDLIDSVLKTQHRVEAIGRPGLWKRDLPGHEDRGDDEFRLLVRNQATGALESFLADAVIDTTGTQATPNDWGLGGMPPLGEVPADDRVCQHLPDILGRDRPRFANRTTLVIGTGCAAAQAVVWLDELSQTAGTTQAVWLARRGDSGPMVTTAVDARLPARRQLVDQAQALSQSSPALRVLRPRAVHAVRAREDQRLDVSIMDPMGSVAECEVLTVDTILALVGSRPDWSIARELQLAVSPFNEAPLAMAQVLAAASDDAAGGIRLSAEALLHPECHIWVLGAKSYGRDGRFLIADGLEQIRLAFSVIGDRPDLNLYQSIRRASA